MSGSHDPRALQKRHKGRFSHTQLQWNQGTHSQAEADTQVCGEVTPWRGGMGHPEGPGGAGEGEPCRIHEAQQGQVQVLQLGQGNSKLKPRLGGEGIESSPEGRIWGVGG